MDRYNPMDEDQEELDVLTGQPLMPNTPRDPDDPREKLRSYLSQRAEADKRMATPEYRQAMRAPQNILQNSNSDLAFSKLLMNAANGIGTIGGKAASSQAYDQFAGELQNQNQQMLQGIDRERAGAMQAEDQRGKMMQYLADKFEQKERNKIQDERYQENMDLKKRMANAAEQQAGMKTQERKDKLAKEDAELNVPGFERTGEVTPSNPEATKARDAVGIANNLMKGLDLLKTQMDESGNFEWGGAKGATMASTAGDLRLQAKELYNLGVLNGPDLQLLLKQIPDTESVSNLFTRTSTSKAQLDATADAMKRKIIEGMAAKGYKAKPGTLERAPSAGSKGMDYDSMSDAELEALLKQRGGK